MSVVIQAGEKASQQVATNRGWADVDDWADDLDNDDYPALLQFIDHGECHDLKALVADIDKAVDAEEPDPDIAKTLRGLRGFAHQNADESYMIITDGFEPGYDEGQSAE